MPAGKHSSPRLILTLPEPLNTRLREQAEREGRPLSDLVREGAESYLETKMTAEYTDRTGNPREFRVPIANPEDAAERLAAVEEIIRRGARFPGNAAGWKVEGELGWEPTPHTSSGGRKMVGKITVRTVGLALASGKAPGDHSTTIYVMQG